MLNTPTRMLLVAAIICLSAALALAQDAAPRRLALLDDAATVETLAAALDDADVVVARTAARLLPSRGEAAVSAVGAALGHTDPLVRRNAAMNLHRLGNAGIALADRALGDESELVRQGVVYSLIELPQTAEVAALVQRAQEDESALVRATAIAAARAAFTTAEAIPLPREGWLIKTDTEEVGVDEKWFAVDLDEAGWTPIAIEEFWGDRGPSSGVGWYRLQFDLPAREKPTRAQLDFQAVDESAWVWLNGEFAGEHDLGPNGWDTPFRLDVTDGLNWGGANQLTVRVLNSAMAGGIWKPVSIVILEPAD
ncbi:MAG: hypothetical protein GX131_08310 [candidate division WS1 bacterium]|jgi:hypothetical protein|nr:hypothetical protein [candidate division WS1 bacterium]